MTFRKIEPHETRVGESTTSIDTTGADIVVIGGRVFREIPPGAIVVTADEETVERVDRAIASCFNDPSLTCGDVRQNIARAILAALRSGA